MTEPEHIAVGDGKYTFVLSRNGGIEEVLRHGEPWPAGTEDARFKGYVLALIQEIQALTDAMKSDSLQ